MFIYHYLSFVFHQFFALLGSHVGYIFFPADGGLDLAAAVELSLPEPNMYIPEDVTVKPLPVEHKSPLMETLEIGALSGAVYCSITYTM